ncbi:MAG TPA: DUF547 domain-containing protein [Anaerolineales bacterium]|nr:DUF547 domain-containing protein [Anaerolineales bacterium]
MLLTDFLISLREKLLDRVSGTDRAWTLNPITLPTMDPREADPAVELVELLHEVLSRELADHEENVDYAALRTSSLYDEFRHCTGNLRAFDPSVLPDRNGRLAFWINLYNTLVLDAVIALGVQRSIIERRAGITFFRQAAYIVGGQRMSCDDIEHGILRANRGHPFFPGRQFHSSDPRFKWVIEPFDARVHFALNCASRSCPPIRAYSPEKMDAQIDLATRSYLAANVQILPEENALRLSSIFKWFARDFGGRDGIIEFVLSHHANRAERLWLSKERKSVSLQYKPYDWGLNGKA